MKTRVIIFSVYMLIGSSCMTYRNKSLESNRPHSFLAHLISQSSLEVIDNQDSQLSAYRMSKEDLYGYYGKHAGPFKYDTKIIFKSCETETSVWARWDWPIAIITLTFYPMRREIICAMEIEVKNIETSKRDFFSVNALFPQRVGLINAYNLLLFSARDRMSYYEGSIEAQERDFDKWK